LNIKDESRNTENSFVALHASEKKRRVTNWLPAKYEIENDRTQ
jgi:hypothetical protein